MWKTRPKYVARFARTLLGTIGVIGTIGVRPAILRYFWLCHESQKRRPDPFFFIQNRIVMIQQRWASSHSSEQRPFPIKERSFCYYLLNLSLDISHQNNSLQRMPTTHLKCYRLLAQPNKPLQRPQPFQGIRLAP